MVDVEVDGESMSVPDDVSLFHALRAQGKHVPGLCNLPELNGYGACRLCLINVDGKVQTACTVHASPGAKVETLNEDIVAMRQTALNLLLSDHQGDCIGPCQRGCPAHSDVQGYLALIAMGRYHEAVCLMKKRYILPAVLGRVCPAFCEDECRRHLVDEPVGIREVKRFAADYDLGHGPWMPEIPAATGKGVAVVGGGPAGLSCAY
ncbi:MAG: 2Fe-2S iron-sulfur cluster-binding protein, partial [Candidatus Thermoplasmatota archaeon]|nr:2Fe-2S iron-sulfur cluster-binding protein [Candidatus Thermoplasmatota archaeon]